METSAVGRAATGRAALAISRGSPWPPADGSTARWRPERHRRSRGPRCSGGRVRTPSKASRRQASRSAGGDGSRKPKMVKATVQSWITGARPNMEARRRATPRQPSTWRVEKAAKTRPTPPHQPPHHPKHQQGEHAVAKPEMPVHGVAADVGRGHEAYHASHQSPVEQAGGQIPYENRMHV